MSRIFGQIAQIGYVVRDLHAAMEFWVAQGVGPWTTASCPSATPSPSRARSRAARFAYLDTETHPGTVIEISDIGGAKGELFTRSSPSPAP